MDSTSTASFTLLRESPHISLDFLALLQKQVFFERPSNQSNSNILSGPIFGGQVRDEANQEQRNKLAKTLFEQILVENNKVVAVKPRHELEPFFKLNLDYHSRDIACDPDGVRGGMQYLADEFFPVNAPARMIFVWTGSIKPNRWPELVEKCRTRSLRQVAREYGVSHETVRRTLKAA